MSPHISLGKLQKTVEYILEHLSVDWRILLKGVWKDVELNTKIIDYVMICRIIYSTCVHASIGWVPGAISSGGGGVKQQGREADHSRPSGTKFKNDGAMFLQDMRLNAVVLHFLSTMTILPLPW
jgi:hypothetical protein